MTETRASEREGKRLFAEFLRFGNTEVEFAALRYYDYWKARLDEPVAAIEALVGTDRRLLAARRLPESFTARDYALLTEQTDQHANNDLAWLVSMRLADRERDDPLQGGKRFRYRLKQFAKLSDTKEAG